MFDLEMQSLRLIRQLHVHLSGETRVYCEHSVLTVCTEKTFKLSHQPDRMQLSEKALIL